MTRIEQRASRALTRPQLFRLLFALHGLVDRIGFPQTGPITLDAQTAQGPLKDLVKLALEIGLVSSLDAEDIASAMFAPAVKLPRKKPAKKPAAIAWPAPIRTIAALKAAVSAGFDLVMVYNGSNARGVYRLMRGAVQAPVTVLSSRIAIAAVRGGQLIAKRRTDGTFIHRLPPARGTTRSREKAK